MLSNAFAFAQPAIKYKQLQSAASPASRLKANCARSSRGSLPTFSFLCLLFCLLACFFYAVMLRRYRQKIRKPERRKQKAHLVTRDCNPDFRGTMQPQDSKRVPQSLYVSDTCWISLARRTEPSPCQRSVRGTCARVASSARAGNRTREQDERKEKAPQVSTRWQIYIIDFLKKMFQT